MKGENQYFNDGWCDVVGSDAIAQHQTWRQGVPYQRRTVGSKRFFEAEQNGHTVTKMIRIPVLGFPLNTCEIAIDGQLYQIVQVQEIDSTFPRCLQVTLEQTGVAWAAQMEE